MVAFLPSSVATKLVTLGQYGSADDKLFTNWSAVATIDRELRWVASGDVIEQIDMPITKLPDGSGQIRLPVTDQAGFVDRSGAPAKDWYYTITYAGFSGKKAKVFQLPGSAPDPFDADNVNDGVAAPPPTAPTGSYVTSVTVAGGAPQTGAVFIDLGGGGPVGSTTVDGIKDATAIGKALLRSADQSAAQTAIGVNDLRSLISSLQDRIVLLEQASNGQAQQIGGLNTALGTKVDKTAIGVTVAPLDGSKKLPLVNLTPQVPLLIGGGTATIPSRPATGNPVIFDVTGATVPATGSTNGGTAAGVNGLDRQWT